MDSQKQNLEVQIRWLIRRDMPEVLEIERSSFEFAWTEEDFLYCMRQRNCVGMVAELLIEKPCIYCPRPPQSKFLRCSECRGTKNIILSEIAGFMIYEFHKARLHILNFAVGTDLRHRGVGSQMVCRLIDKLYQQSRKEIILNVRESNLAAQLFFKSQGFKSTGILRNYYEDTAEDAYSMQYRLKPQNSIYSPPQLQNRISQYDAA